MFRIALDDKTETERNALLRDGLDLTEMFVRLRARLGLLLMVAAGVFLAIASTF